MALLLTALLGVIAAAALLYGLPYLLRRVAEWRLARRCVAGRALVLSFDDGPSPKLTPRLLDLLDEFAAPATFFPLGRQARAHPDVLAEVVRRGHEVGCHSEQHGHSLRTGPLRAARDALDGLRTLEPWLGKRRLFRPPFGKIDLVTWLLLHRRGIRIGWWTLESGDTLGADDPSAIVRSVLRRGGAVVLLHDFDGRPERSDYVAAVTAGLLAAAREHGLRVVPLGSLL